MEFDARGAEAYVLEHERDPWSVFRRIFHAPPALCPLADLDVWHEWGLTLHAANPQAPTASEPGVHRIFNLINAIPGGPRPPSFGAVSADPALWPASPAGVSRTRSAESLNAPLTVEEVARAIERVPYHKSPGPDPVPGEAWRCAREAKQGDPDQPGAHLLAPHLAALCMALLLGGQEPPPSFSASTWTPIFKKGDAQQCTNYRGLAVGGIVNKIYMALLTRRISDWADKEGTRHPAQAGFMRGLGTQHHHLLMRYLVTCHSLGLQGRAARMCKPLFVCQVDFKKAFDTVQRAILWQRMRERGVHGVMLAALQRSYDNVVMRPKVNGKLGAPFPCEQGVKQGDPSSPDLFGFYIEVFAEFIEAMDKHELGIHCPTTGRYLPPCTEEAPVLGTGPASVRLASALFADDVNLLALSAGRMNYLLALLDVFCGAFGMTVNVPKCELLVFHPVLSERKRFSEQAISYQGQTLTPTARARYLGLFYGPPSGRGAARESLFTNSCVELLAAGKRAQHAVAAKLAAHGMHVPHTSMVFYNTCVRSVFSFGAQVWSTPYLTADFDVAMRHEMVKTQRDFMQRLVGASSPPSRVLYMELSELPFQHHWAGLVFRFWNSLTAKPCSFAHAVLRADVQLALERKVGWAHEVISFLSRLAFSDLPDPGLPLADRVDAYVRLRLPVSSLQRDIARSLMKAWHNPDLASSDPRTYAGTSGLSICRYVRWMGVPGLDERADGRPHTLPHTTLGIAHERHTCLIRFRLGVWDLAINRSSGGARLRADRVCDMCLAGGRGLHIEDEQHVLIECPEFDSLRTAFADRLPFEEGMLAVMQCASAKDLAHFVSELRLQYVEMHDRCVDNKACQTCHRRDGESKMLLCDGRCGHAYHTKCLDPPLEHVPRGAWFCSDCLRLPVA